MLDTDWLYFIRVNGNEKMAKSQSAFSSLPIGINRSVESSWPLDATGMQTVGGRVEALSGANQASILRHMKVEEIAEAVAKLPPDQLARFRRWFAAFEAGRTDHVEELGSSATKLGRLAGRAFAELKRRVKEP
jgi:hypothetical protein